MHLPARLKKHFSKNRPGAAHIVLIVLALAGLGIVATVASSAGSNSSLEGKLATLEDKVRKAVVTCRKSPRHGTCTKSKPAYLQQIGNIDNHLGKRDSNNLPYTISFTSLERFARSNENAFRINYIWSIKPNANVPRPPPVLYAFRGGSCPNNYIPVRDEGPLIASRDLGAEKRFAVGSWTMGRGNEVYCFVIRHQFGVSTQGGQVQGGSPDLSNQLIIDPDNPPDSPDAAVDDSDQPGGRFYVPFDIRSYRELYLWLRDGIESFTDFTAGSEKQNSSAPPRTSPSKAPSYTVPSPRIQPTGTPVPVSLNPLPMYATQGSCSGGVSRLKFSWSNASQISIDISTSRGAPFTNFGHQKVVGLRSFTWDSSHPIIDNATGGPLYPVAGTTYYWQLFDGTTHYPQQNVAAGSIQATACTQTTTPPSTQPPTTSSPKCGGDVNGDGVVTTTDITTVSKAYGTNDPRYDLNRDGIVNTADILIVQKHYGQCTPL